MGPRRDLRREVGILSRKLYFNAGAFTGEERDHLNKRIAQLREILNAQTEGRDVTVTDEEIDTREDMIKNSDELKEVLQAFWALCLPHTIDGVLKKEFYIKLQVLFTHALLGVGAVSSNDALTFAEEDWKQDAFLFGPMNRTAFFGVIYELVYTWQDNATTAKNYAIFAWSLLSSIADMTLHPPILRVKRTIPCVSRIREGDMYKQFFKDTALRKAIFVETTKPEYTTQQNVDSLLRMSIRNKNQSHKALAGEVGSVGSGGIDLTSMQSMLAIVARRAEKERLANGDWGDDTDTDSATNASEELSEEGSVEWRRKKKAREAAEAAAAAARAAEAEQRRRAALLMRRDAQRRLRGYDSRSYWLEEGRGEGADVSYQGKIYSMEDISEHTLLLNPSMNNWIGSIGKLRDFQKQMLVKFLADRLAALSEGKTPEEIAALAETLDFRSLRIMWLAHLAAHENERRYTPPVTTEIIPLQGMFGIAPKNPSALTAFYAAKEKAREMIRQAGKGRSAKKALEQVLALSNKNKPSTTCLDDIMLVGTGELVVSKKPQPTSPIASWVSSGVGEHESVYTNMSPTPSYTNNFRSQSGRPEGRKQPSDLVTLPTIGSKHAKKSHGRANTANTVSTGRTWRQSPRSRSPDTFDDATVCSDLSDSTRAIATKVRSTIRGEVLAAMPPQLRKQIKAKDDKRKQKVETLQQSVALQQLSSTYGFEFDLEDGSTDHLNLNLDLSLDLGRFQDHLEQGDLESPEAASKTEAGAADAKAGEEEDGLELELELLELGVGGRDDVNELCSPTPHRSLPPPVLFKGEQQWTQEGETSPIGRLDLSWDDSFVRALVTGTLNSMRSNEPAAEAEVGGDDVSSAFSLTAAPETGSPRFAAAATSDNHRGRSSPSSVTFHPDTSTYEGSTISFDGSILSRSSTLSRGSNKPSLILPKLLVVLEELYIASATQTRSIFSWSKWAGAGAAIRKRKEEDAKWLAETAPR
jgi:hypothetical protein